MESTLMEKSCQIHNEESADQRYRNHDAGNQRNTPVAQKKEDNNDNQDESYVNGFFHFADRGTDEFGVIESVRILHVFREVLLHLLHAFIYRIGYLYMVGTRLGDYNDSHHGYTIHLHVAFDVGRAQFGSSDITETDDAVVLFFDRSGC